MAANYSRELADFIIYVVSTRIYTLKRKKNISLIHTFLYTPQIDVSGGDKIPRKGGPGITQSDLLVINKTDLATLIGADLDVMDRDARKMREGGPTIFAQVKHGKGVDEIIDLILSAWRSSGASETVL